MSTKGKDKEMMITIKDNNITMVTATMVLKIMIIMKRKY